MMEGEEKVDEGTASQNEPNGPADHPLIHTLLEENGHIQKTFLNSDTDMNGKVGNRGQTNDNVEANSNANNLSMASYPSRELQNHSQPHLRTPKKAATFGKRSNSMRRNPNAEVTKQGWLYKQASSGVKQWNKRWFVLTDRCLFYYKDEKEDVVLGSLPLLSFRIGPVQPSDNIGRKFAFKVWFEEEEEKREMEMEDEKDSKGSMAFCLQAEHAGTRTYFFGTDNLEDREEWVQAMTEAARVHVPLTTRRISEPLPTEEQNHITLSKAPETNSCPEKENSRPERPRPGENGVNGIESRETSTPATPAPMDMDSRQGDKGCPPSHQPNGWGNYGSRYQSQENIREVREVRPEPQENLVLRRGFVPRTGTERMAQRKSSMTQLQQWVNQRRVVTPQDDPRSSRYHTVNRGMSADYFGMYGGPPYPEDYQLYPPGIRPDSICSMSAAYDRMVIEDKRRSLRDIPLYGPPREPQWIRENPGSHPAYYNQAESTQGTLKRLTLQPRSRSVPRSPSSSSGGPYSPGPQNFISPARSPSMRFDRVPGRLREEGLYVDPAVYGMRRSISSPKYDFPRDRQSLSQSAYHYNYPASPSLHGKMAPPFDVYRELHPTLKINELETTKLLNRLCEQNRLLKEQEAVVQRLRMDKDNLEASLVATHQDMELCRTQPHTLEKLQLKKESLQNQLINVRGELSQATSALATSQMEFEALEDDVNIIHGDLWEQLNAGGQSELVHRHLQKEFWRVQDVLEGLHKNNPSRGTDTAKYRVSGASGSFSNSPASPLSSVSLTSPLSPFSPVPGSQNSPTKQLPTEHKYSSVDGKTYDLEQDRKGNKVGVPSKTKSPIEDKDAVHKRNGKIPNGHISRERPKSAMFPAEVKSKMSVEEQNERIRRNQSTSVRDKRRSLNLSNNQNLDGSKSSVNYRVIRRRLTAHEVDIKDLEMAVRGQGVESPREEIARLRRQGEPEHYDLIGKELSTPDKVLIPERYVEIEPSTPLSPEEEKEKQKKVERIKTLIAKSNLQNIVPALDGPAETQTNPEQKLQEQEKRIEISCALAAEASRRSRLLSVQTSSSPPASPTDLTPLPSSGFSDSSHIMKV
ncbi:pleckstrin homology domain-containing family A member 6 isoform X2 [Trichomycterus rosablanca]|uniref:pleckstrin homology domain-containing family A member 6 isoform X2 n=1 Tax=Trichomycterus rosablanca TaxID=2290929 RepID=UPI002F355D0E